MRLFGLGNKRTQHTIVKSGKIALKDHGEWSVTAAAAYRRISIAAAQLTYETERGKDSAGDLSGVLATAIAAKIAYGVTIVNVDKEVWAVLDNDRLEILFDEADRIVGFTYLNFAGNKVAVTNFLYSANSAPGRVLVGALHDAAEDIKAENMTQAVAASLGENMSYIGLVAYVKGENDPVKLQAIADSISGAFTGDNRGGVLALSDNVKVESLLNMTQLNPIGTENLKASRQAIAAAFGSPYDLLYTDSSNRASVDSAKDLLFRDTIVPAAKAIVSDFGNTSKYGRITLSEASLLFGQSATQVEAAKLDQAPDATKPVPGKTEPAEPIAKVEGASKLTPLLKTAS